MKTIKEKAKEHSLEPRANAYCGYDEEDLEDSFEVGANYVLDNVKILLNTQRFVDNPSQELFELIEQLKK